MNQTLTMPRLLGTYLATALFAVGCDQPTSTSDTEPAGTAATAVSIVVDSEPSKKQRTAMLAAKNALFQRLSGRLKEGMARGPAHAIRVCQKEATQIATAIGEEHGVQIGRVGVRLRNPTNTGPEWAAPLIQSRSNTPLFAHLSNGHAAALLPIKLQAQCLVCHGPRDQIVPVIREELAKLYPDDEAIGFRDGELRGWFWVEKPPD